jgi:aspartate kinase
VQEAAAVVGATGISHDENVAKVSVVGLGMARQAGVADTMFAALAKANVNIEMITTSEVKISVLVSRDQAQTALRAVHRAFSLHEQPKGAPVVAHPSVKREPRDAVDVIEMLQGVDMEELVINEITLDQSQARVTIDELPDEPGMSAKLFNEVAAAGVFVDMIVQSSGSDGVADLSFTMPHEQLGKALAVAGDIADRYKCKAVGSSPNIAKLSVSGIGLRSHTGVAIRMFKALSEANVNVSMINTSEVRVNVVVNGDQGQRALERLQAAFADVQR